MGISVENCDSMHYNKQEAAIKEEKYILDSDQDSTHKYGSHIVNIQANDSTTYTKHRTTIPPVCRKGGKTAYPPYLIFATNRKKMSTRVSAASL